MSIPQSNQTVHLMNWCDVLHELRTIEGRTKSELLLYTTDDLRRLYQDNGDKLIRLRDGILTRTQLYAVIRWRVFWARRNYEILLAATVIGAVAAIFAAVEGWRSQ